MLDLGDVFAFSSSNYFYNRPFHSLNPPATCPLRTPATMAGPNAAKNLQGNRPRPRPIVPAIPLPYIQKRKQSLKSETKSELKAPNDSSTTPKASASMPNINESDGAVAEPDHINNEENKSPKPSSDMGRENDIVAVEQCDLETAANGTENRTTQQGPTDSVDSTIVDSQAAKSGQPTDCTTEPSTSSSDSHPSNSRSHNTTAPAFVREQQAISNGQLVMPFRNNVSLPFSGGSTHNSHPSQGSLVFGGYPDSHNGSPAHLNGPFSPPQIPPPHMNGFSVMPPPGFGMASPQNQVMHNPGFEFPQRNPFPYAPSPIATPAFENPRQQLDTSTPHSFQMNTPPPGFVNGHMRRDSGGIFDHGNVPSRRGSVVPGIQGQAVDDLDGLATYVQSLFGDSTLSDYAVEINFGKIGSKTYPPFLIYGHGIILARSPVLKELILKARESEANVAGPRKLSLKALDYYARGDSFWNAIRRLYGGALITVDTVPEPLEPRATAEFIGRDENKFDFALGYAVAGQVLYLPPITIRGIDVACQFVSWQTVEKALDFGLRGGLHPQWSLGSFFEKTGPSFYGPHANALVHTALNFIVANFPSNFIFDRSAPDATLVLRLPGRVSQKHNSRLSSIKFGELPSEEDVQAGNVRDMSVNAVLSRLLVNLYFPLLKYVLESPLLGAATDGIPQGLRSHLMHEIIEEREKRRSLLKDDTKIPNSERIVRGHDWQTVGWSETVQIDPIRKVPVLSRHWVDFKLPG